MTKCIDGLMSYGSETMCFYCLLYLESRTAISGAYWENTFVAAPRAMTDYLLKTS